MRKKRQQASAMDSTLAERLAHLDLRTWVIEYLRWHEWGTRREFTLLTAQGIGLAEATSAPGAPLVLGEIDAGELRITSRRITLTGRGFVRSTAFRDIVGWSFGDSSVSVAAAGAERIWHATGCTQSDAFLAAVIVNLAENFVGDDVPGLDHVTALDVEAYIEAFERQEVEPARQQVAQTAAEVEQWRQRHGLE